MVPAHVNVSFQSCEDLKRHREAPEERQDALNSLASLNTHSNNDVSHIDPIRVLKRFDQTGHLRIGRVFCESDTEENV